MISTIFKTQFGNKKKMTKSFVPLESNPEVLTKLAHSIGMPSRVIFQDVFAIDDAEMLAFVNRPALALMLVFPNSDAVTTNSSNRQQHDHDHDHDVIWLKQTIRNACGTYALLHATLNGPAKDLIVPGSFLSGLRHDLRQLGLSSFSSSSSSSSSHVTEQRARLIESSSQLESLHAAVALDGVTQAPAADSDDVDLHYVAFVKQASALYELDGRKSGPVLLTQDLDPHDDVLAAGALKFVKQFISDRDDHGTNSNFSLVALVQS
ncbi:hypothetical protein V1514DRAFT_325172 [Lipomyces japonicus]|uniref:uncharacterized protein n=1 Tax=Lipomyces japonicus TaxID=56871 RepID=UPI0034CE3C1E